MATIGEQIGKDDTVLKDSDGQRLGIIRVDLVAMAKALDLPEGYKIACIWEDFEFGFTRYQIIISHTPEVKGAWTGTMRKQPDGTWKKVA